MKPPKRARLSDYAEHWLEDRASRRRRESTVHAYETRLRSYVLPELGGSLVGEITGPDIEDMYDELMKRGLGLETIKGARNALSAVLSYAVRARHLAANPVKDSELPDKARRTARVKPPTAEQVGALLDAADGTPLSALLLVLATTGMRIGKVLGLKWSDLDLDKGSLDVERTTTRPRTGQYFVGETTKPGDSRTLILAPEAVQALREQKGRSPEAAFDEPLMD